MKPALQRLQFRYVAVKDSDRFIPIGFCLLVLALCCRAIHWFLDLYFQQALNCTHNFERGFSLRGAFCAVQRIGRNSRRIPPY